MSGGWQLFLFLFILGVVAGTFNQFGVAAWGDEKPEMDYTITEGTITSVQESATSSPITIFVIYMWVVAFVTIIFDGILAVLSLGTLFYALGWPVGLLEAALLQILQLPANLIIFAWLFELWTGRSIG